MYELHQRALFHCGLQLDLANGETQQELKNMESEVRLSIFLAPSCVPQLKVIATLSFGSRDGKGSIVVGPGHQTHTSANYPLLNS